MNPRTSQGGFSLVEVLCAILILGVGLAGLTTAVTAALRSTRDAELHSAAALHAAGVIERLRAEGYYLAGETEEECGESLPGCRCRQVLAETDLDGLFEVSVAVIHSPTQRTLFELQTLLFEPPFSTQSDDAETRRRRPQRR